MTTSLVDLQVDLPEHFVVIVPSSPNDPRPDRTFTDSDWEAVHAYLEDQEVVGVILNSGTSDYTHPNIINLTGQTTILEAIEIMKRSQGYIGTDSSLSILAGQMFVSGIHVKSSGKHMAKWKGTYYAIRQDHDFIRPDLSHLKIVEPT